jgi:2-polyprenyl-3-methyl-5-hydroxy-6-metoxy-1,4-benzoquinol methylase
MRQRTSAAPGFDYQIERHNETWCDHIARTNVTAGLISWLRPKSLIDPACGDGSIVLSADRTEPIERMVLSDISRPNYGLLGSVIGEIPFTKGIDLHCQTIEEALRTDERFDLIVLTEVLEHLEDPDTILRQARTIASRLIASSPEMRPGQTDTNPEHLWMFDSDGYMKMLIAAGWTPIQKTGLAFLGLEYDFQIWVCR